MPKYTGSTDLYVYYIYIYMWVLIIYCTWRITYYTDILMYIYQYTLIYVFFYNENSTHTIVLDLYHKKIFYF